MGADGGVRALEGATSRGVTWMGDRREWLRPIPSTEKELREESRREREDRERRDAMLRAEQAGRASAPAVEAWWDHPVGDGDQFVAQLMHLDQQADSVPRVDSVLKEEASRQVEASRLNDALRDAERTELRLEAQETREREEG
jgi:hypothetical protein